MHTKPKDTSKNFASIAETARSHLSALEQECTRWKIGMKIQKLCKIILKKNFPDVNHFAERKEKIISSIRVKLQEKNAIALKSTSAIL